MPLSHAQDTFNMGDTIVTDCKGYFYDSQGPSASYLFDEDYTFSIHNGGVITLNFDTFFKKSLCRNPAEMNLKSWKFI